MSRVMIHDQTDGLGDGADLSCKPTGVVRWVAQQIDTVPRGGVGHHKNVVNHALG